MNTVTNIHDCEKLIEIFDRCFAQGMNTRLLKGGKEPIYLPQDEQQSYNRIIFTRDYFASALHEVAHWCIAGEARLSQVDFGYWYAPDGRSVEQQKAFELVEVKPQAVEWLLQVACGHRFRVSTDNLSGEETNPNNFKAAVYAQVLNYCEGSFPKRAIEFAEALSNDYAIKNPFSVTHYSLDNI